MYTTRELPTPCDSPDYGCIAVNASGELLASLSSWKSMVYVYNLTTFKTVGQYGCNKSSRSRAGFCFGGSNNGIAFVPTNENVVVCDSCNERLVEITCHGTFVRTLLLEDKEPVRVACSDTYIVVTTMMHERYFSSSVIVIDYASADVLRTVNGDAFYMHLSPYFSGVRFSADCLSVMLVDTRNNHIVRVSMDVLLNYDDTVHDFDIIYDRRFNRPCDLLQLEDGTLVVANGYGHNVLFMSDDSTVTQTVDFQKAITYPFSLALHPSKGVCVKESRRGAVFAVQYPWAMLSHRRLWVRSVS